MEKFVIGIVGCSLIFLTIFFYLRYSNAIRDTRDYSTPMIITSPAFNTNEIIPRKFTCDGGNINPELHIQNVPEAAKSLALIMHDPDAPMPGGFTHWVVWNIAPATIVIKQESIPPNASEGWNSSRNAGYTGPCPPSGTHRYFFKLYALDTVLSLPPETKKDELELAMNGHGIANAEIVGLYARGK